MGGGRDHDQLPPNPAEGLGEEAWIEVIQKMDEVYSDLIRYEVALEDKNAALEDSQRFALSVLGSMSDLLAVCDRDGRIEVVNRALTAFTGRPESDLVGSPLFDLFADEATRATARDAFVARGKQGLYDCELDLRAADGTAVAVSLNCMPRHGQHGVPLGLVVTGRPLGELRRAYRELHEAHEDLKRTQQQLLHSEKMASLGRLVAGVAHELNNPISFVLGNVHALERYAQRLVEYLAAVHGGASGQDLTGLRRGLHIDRVLEDLPSLIEGTLEGAERTRDIVDSLKRFSVADRDLHQPFNLVEVIERALDWVVKGADPAGGFCVTLDLPEGISLQGSPGRIQQVAMNLIQNALDATAGTPAPSLAISARPIGGVIEVRFVDNGPGLSPTQLAHCFEPFYTTKPVGKGTGLGLSNSYGLVAQHGGHLAVTNNPEGGACFTLTLPLPGPPGRTTS